MVHKQVDYMMVSNNHYPKTFAILARYAFGDTCRFKMHIFTKFDDFIRNRLLKIIGKSATLLSLIPESSSVEASTVHI